MLRRSSTLAHPPLPANPNDNPKWLSRSMENPALNHCWIIRVGYVLSRDLYPYPQIIKPLKGGRTPTAALLATEHPDLGRPDPSQWCQQTLTETGIPMISRPLGPSSSFQWCSVRNPFHWCPFQRLYSNIQVRHHIWLGLISQCDFQQAVYNSNYWIINTSIVSVICQWLV
jgi:hypothetical protein